MQNSQTQKKRKRGSFSNFAGTLEHFTIFSLLSLYIYIYIYYYSTTYRTKLPIILTLFLFHSAGTQPEHAEHAATTLAPRIK